MTTLAPVLQISRGGILSVIVTHHPRTKTFALEMRNGLSPTIFSAEPKDFDEFFAKLEFFITESYGFPNPKKAKKDIRRGLLALSSAAQLLGPYSYSDALFG